MELIAIGLLAAVALAAVLYPVLRPSGQAPAPLDVEAEVLRYREALRAGTVCERCKQANPPGSRYCGDCGRPLDTAAETRAAPR